MKLTKFSKELKVWRGNRGQKNAADLIDVNLRTYEGWESGRMPSRYAINRARQKMEISRISQPKPCPSAQQSLAKR
jgi:DNA-binding XRE family transcriptional regulator